jgi:DNA polymerase-4
MIAHLDLDAFFAACEVLDHPEYAGKPLVVAGDPHGRGVVMTASYEARPFGIRSAMNAAEALRRCPNAIFVRPDHDRYRRRSRAVWDWIRGRMSCVEQVGIDEGYFELQTPYAEPARAILFDLQQGLLRETRLSASIGCGGSKTVAKIASDFRKPAGLTVVPPEQSASFLAPLELRALPGIGPRLEARLSELKLRTIGDLAALSNEALARSFPGSVARPGARNRRAPGRPEPADAGLAGRRGDLPARSFRGGGDGGLDRSPLGQRVDAAGSARSLRAAGHDQDPLLRFPDPHALADLG